jgi:peptidase C50-like protein
MPISKTCDRAIRNGYSWRRLMDAGKFEVHGTAAWTYMTAVCAAVVEGMLWEVTDRGIDRYALRLLQEWGNAWGKGSSAWICGHPGAQPDG